MERIPAFATESATAVGIDQPRDGPIAAAQVYLGGAEDVGVEHVVDSR